MSVPVVPSKSARQAAADSPDDLTWPPPENPRFSVDVMDLATNRVMTTGQAAAELSGPAAADNVAVREEPPRPIAFVRSLPAGPAAPPPHAERLDAAAAPSHGTPDQRPPAVSPLMRTAIAVIAAQTIVIAVFAIRGRSPHDAPAPARPAASGDTRTAARPAPPVDVPAPMNATMSAPPRPVATTGRLLVRSYPAGAPVTVDGKRRGAAPLTVDDLAAGEHRVQLGAPTTAIEQTVTIEAGTTTTLVAPVQSTPATAAAGWVNIASAIEVQVIENGRTLGTSTDGPLRLAAGTHNLQLANDRLGYRGQESVAVRAGDITRLRPTLPDGVVHVNAQPWASVWIDGERVGDTPLANIKVALGRHEIRFRHPSLGEQVRQVVVAATEPARISVNMKP